MPVDLVHRKGIGHWMAILGVAAVTAMLAPFQAWLSAATVALAYLLLVLFLATIWGRAPAIVASALATVCFNFFFLPPIFTFTIADPQNWVALAAFLVTAITAGDLAERAKRRSAVAAAATAVSAYNRSLIEATVDPLMTIDAEGKIIDVNTAMERVTGRTRAQLAGTDFSACFTQPEQIRAAYRQAWHVGFVRDQPVELQHVNGQVTSGLCRASVYRDEKGAAIGVVAAIRPIRASAGQLAQAVPDSRLARGLQRFTAFASIASAGVGLLGLVGWMLGVPVLLSVIPGFVIIRPNAAVCLVVLGLSLWLMQEQAGPLAKYRKLGGQVLAILAAVVGLLNLMENLAGWDFGIDQLLFPQTTSATIAGLRPGLMSPVTALDLLLLGIALCMLDWTIPWGSHRYSPAQICASVAVIVSVVGLLDLIFASAVLPYTYIALQTAVSLILLSLGVMFARTGHGLPALLVSSSVGGTLVRRLLPASICIPILIGGLWWQFLAAEVSPNWGSRTLMILVMVAMLGGFTAIIGFLADRSDVARRNAEGALHQSEEELREAQRLARVGSWWWDPRTDRITWSEELYRIVGREPTATPIGYSDQARIYTPDSFERLDAAVQETLRTGKRYELELEVLTADGRRRAVTARGEAERDVKGQIVVLRSTLHDITERKRAEERLQRVNRAHRALSMTNQALVRATDESTLLQKICQVIVVQAGYRMCWVGFAEQDAAKTVRSVAQAGVDEGYLKSVNITWADTERGHGPTGTCIRTGETQIARDIASDPRLVPWRADAAKRGYASSIAIPLMAEGKAFGALTIYSSEVAAFVDEEVELLTELADDLGYGIASLRMQTARKKAEAEEAAHEREVAIGFKIQQMLLLDEPPDGIKGLRTAAISIPSQRVAGDFYQFFTHKDESVDVIVADVMGKGVPAALLGAATKSHFTQAMCHLMALSPRGVLPEPRDIVTLAHTDMAPHLIELESFVTMSYARVDLVRQHLTLVDCGHTGLIHLRGESRQGAIIHGDNLPLGIRTSEIYNQVDVPFEIGDTFVFYSDGITEASNTAGELFGTDRLMDCTCANAALGPRALVDAIRTAVAAFAQLDQFTDDLTCVVVQLGDRTRNPARQEIVIHGDLRDLRRAREFIRNFCAGLPGSWLDQDEVAKLELAVDEAVSNVIKHVYHERAEEGIHVEARALDDRVAVRLLYIGDVFDPSIVPPPSLDGSRESGFGLYLITHSVDDVRYYRDDGGRSCIELIKNRRH